MAGPSGVGKNTVIIELIKRNKNFALHKTMTSRTPRNEDDKKVYDFVSKEEFERKIANGEMLEFEDVHGNWYGSDKELFLKSINSGKTLLKDIDVKGQITYKKLLSGITPVLSVFLNAPKEKLVERLKGRGESLESIQKRMERVDMELGFSKNFDLVIENVSLDETVKIIEKQIEKMEKNK